MTQIRHTPDIIGSNKVHGDQRLSKSDREIIVNRTHSRLLGTSGCLLILIVKLSLLSFEAKYLVLEICNHTRNNSIWSVIDRLTLAAAVYYIWQERNLRTNENRKRTVDQVVSLIFDSVRLRLGGLRFKISSSAVQALNIWELKSTIDKLSQLKDSSPNEYT
ncbi:hypothetical protein R6Q59_010290 [Mikania micrantha]